MRFIADLHIHSRFAYACSDRLNVLELTKWGMLKGITVLATGDFTHPLWRNELKRDLVPTGNGLFVPQDDIIKQAKSEVPPSCHSDIYFMLESEVSCIYSKNDKVRKIHHLLYVPEMDLADSISEQLEKIGNLASDGRPILGLDSKELLKIVRNTHPKAYLVPAHAWTPHFAIFGSNSGFDSLEECFEDMTSEIFAIETGLSSDPEMNRQWSALDGIALISSSDSHSAPRIGREANILDTETSYDGIWDAVKARDRQQFVGTIEFYPHEGRYHYDGHRKCDVCLHPNESKEHNNMCPVCGRKLTLGVLHRVNALSDRAEGQLVEPYQNLIPLGEIIAEVEGVKSTTSKKVQSAYFNLLSQLGPELHILMDTPLDDIEATSSHLLAKAIEKVRNHQASVKPGYDGLYGEVAVFDEEERKALEQEATNQLSLL